MTPHPSQPLAALVRALCREPHESEWLEFKENQAHPETIGQNVSGLANFAVIADRPRAWIVWGVRNHDHRIVGTSFDPFVARKGAESLETWLHSQLRPRPGMRFRSVVIEGKPVLLLEIEPAVGEPVRFGQSAYIRVGSSTRRLADASGKQRQLWRILGATDFENGAAAENLTDSEALNLLDYPVYFDLLKRRQPTTPRSILDALESDRLVRRNLSGRWEITNLGGVLLARRLADFRLIGRKALRVIRYEGKGRVFGGKETELEGGYARALSTTMALLDQILPANEVIEQALRRTVPMFPPLAVRELVANALIHQDFSQRGAGPMIEIFDDRIEVTNPGTPLVPTDRFVDSTPKSRNEALAAVMRRLGHCEERGSGIDKVIALVEAFQLPPPRFETPPEATRVVLFAPKDFGKMERSERVWASYLHACLRFVTSEFLTNSSLRERFGIAEKNRATVSRLIREARKARLITPFEKDASPQSMKYIPWWAAQENGGAPED